MNKLSKNEIKERIADAFSYFSMKLYEREVFGWEQKNNDFCAETGQPFTDDDDLSELLNWTEDDILSTPGMGVWEKTADKIAVVLSPPFLSILPTEFEVECVLPVGDGTKRKVCSLTNGDMDTRFGMTAWGFFVKNVGSNTPKS